MEQEVVRVEEADRRLGLGRISSYQARTRLQENSNPAVNTLLAVVEDEGALSLSRVIAARAVLELGCEAEEIEDLKARVAALEKDWTMRVKQRIEKLEANRTEAVEAELCGDSNG